jgi:hypothetical protein
MKSKLIRLALGLLYLSGAHRLLEPMVKGVGAILMLHRVRPADRISASPHQGMS